jgi:Xaa-Pro dipeptidase
MRSQLSIAERDRRWTALSEAMDKEGFDALIFVANDYRGHKGSLRYVADYNLIHRYGYAVLPQNAEPIVVLPMNLKAGGPQGDWVADVRYPRHTTAGLADVVQELPKRERIGIVGLAQVMRVEDYQGLTQAIPDTQFEDASELFERVRSEKSPAEVRGVEESGYILDRCFEQLVEVARPGLTERELGAEMHRTAARLGGQDFLFLTMYGRPDNGAVVPAAGEPGGRILGPNDQFIFSFELIGPSGYWVELSRTIVFSGPSEVQERLGLAVSNGIDAAQKAATPGATSGDVQKAILEACESHGASSTYWSGHGIGQDVIEEPWIGLELVQDEEAVRRSDVPLREGMVLAVHPFVSDDGGAGIAYMADILVVEADGSRKISEHPLTLYKPHRRG